MFVYVLFIRIVSLNYLESVLLFCFILSFIFVVCLLRLCSLYCIYIDPTVILYIREVVLIFDNPALLASLFLLLSRALVVMTAFVVRSICVLPQCYTLSLL